MADIIAKGTKLENAEVARIADRSREVKGIKLKGYGPPEEQAQEEQVQSDTATPSAGPSDVGAPEATKSTEPTEPIRAVEVKTGQERETAQGRRPGELWDVPREVEMQRPQLGESPSIEEISAAYRPYYDYQVRKYSEKWQNALGITMPNPDEIPSLKPTELEKVLKEKVGELTPEQRWEATKALTGQYGPLREPTQREIKRAKRLRPHGYATADRQQGLVLPISEQEKILDLGANYGPPPERWIGENLGMERPKNVMQDVPDIYDVIRALAIKQTHDTLSLSDFFRDVADPNQQASIARAHNDLLWANTVIDEYGKSHGTATMTALGLVGGTYGLLGNPVDNFIFFNVVAGVSKKVATALTARLGAGILAKLGAGKVGSFLARVPRIAAQGLVAGGITAVKRELEWNKVGPRLAEEMGVDVKDLDSEAISHGVMAGILLGLGGGLVSNKSLLMDAMPTHWNQVMDEAMAKAYTNIIGEKTESLIGEFFQSKPKGHNYTAQDWRDFVVDKFADPKANLEGVQSIEPYTNKLEETAKGTIEDTSIFNLKDRYEVKVEGNQATHNPDKPIKNEAQLGEEYNAIVKERVTKLAAPTETVGLLGRIVLKMSNIADATEKMLLNKLYSGLSRDEAKVLYKKSVDDAFNKAYYEALVGKKPESFMGHFTNDIAGNKFLQNALDMNKMVIDGLRERGVAVSELEAGYIRQTHNRFKMMGVKEQDWVNYTYQRLDHNKSFKEIYNTKHINAAIQELDKTITETKAAIAENKSANAELTQHKSNRDRLKAITERTEEQKIEYQAAKAAYREARQRLQESNKQMRGIKEALPGKNIKKDLREAEKYRKRLQNNLNLTPEQQEAMAKTILSDTYRSITLEGGEGTMRIGGTGRYHKQRELHFKDFDSWNSYQQDYGHGMSALQATIDHMQASSKKLAVLEMLGPNPMGLKRELEPLVQNLRGQKLSRAAREQLELFEDVMNNVTEQQVGNPIAGTSIGFRLVDNMNTIAATDLLKNVARYGMMFEPMQTAFWAREFGLVEKGIWRTQAEGLKNMLRTMGALGKKGAELLRIIPKADQEEMTLLGFLYHNNNNYIQAAEHNMNLNKNVVKFSRKAGQVFGSDLMQEVSYVNASSLWTYRTGQFIREGTTWSALNPQYQRVLRRYGVNEAEWNSLLTSKKGMMESHFAGTGKEDSVRAQSFSAMKLFNEATTKAEAELGRKMYYAQNEFVRLSAMQSDRMINQALKGMIGVRRDTTAGQIVSRLVEGFYAFAGYDAHLMAQLRQVGIESGNTLAPGVGAWFKWAGTMFGASYLTNAMTDILKGREINFSPQGILRDTIRAVTMVGGMQYGARIMWEAIEATADEHSSGIGKGLDLASKAMPTGINYFWNKGGNAAKAWADFMGGDNARAMYHARKAVPFADWLPTDLIVNRLLIDNIFYNLDGSAAYRAWLMESKQANNTGKAFNLDDRPGSWVIDNAPNVVNR